MLILICSLSHVSVWQFFRKKVDCMQLNHLNYLSFCCRYLFLTTDERYINNKNIDILYTLLIVEIKHNYIPQYVSTNMYNSKNLYSFITFYHIIIHFIIIIYYTFYLYYNSKSSNSISSEYIIPRVPFQRAQNEYRNIRWY